MESNRVLEHDSASLAPNKAELTEANVEGQVATEVEASEAVFSTAAADEEAGEAFISAEVE